MLSCALQSGQQLPISLLYENNIYLSVITIKSIFEQCQIAHQEKKSPNWEPQLLIKGCFKDFISLFAKEERVSESTQERGEGQTEAGMLTPENLEISQERRLITYKGSFLKLTANILTETIEDRRQRDDILKILNQKKKKAIK